MGKNKRKARLPMTTDETAIHEAFKKARDAYKDLINSLNTGTTRLTQQELDQVFSGIGGDNSSLTDLYQKIQHFNTLQAAYATGGPKAREFQSNYQVLNNIKKNNLYTAAGIRGHQPERSSRAR